jgi:hypothetical protein
MVKARGGFVFKVHGSETMMAGLPDLIVCYRGIFIGFEVKTPTGHVSERQRYVMRQVMNAQGIVTVPRSVTDASDVLDRVDVWLNARGDVSNELSDLFWRDSWRA